MSAQNPLKLNAEAVDARVNQAAASSTRTWVPADCECGGTIEEVRRTFTAARVWPTQGAVEVEIAHSAHLGVSPGDHRVWYVARRDGQAVFFEERTGCFGVGWGPKAGSDSLVDLGIRTEDPIDAFLA